jgi:hypothetical protein
MPMFRQGSVGATPVIAVPPLAGTRAGTVNPAGGLSAAIDGTNYKSGTLVVYVGNMTATTGACTAKVQSSDASGGTYADITGAAVTGFGPSDDNTVQYVDFDFPAGQPFVKVVLTAAAATDVTSAMVILHGDMRS